MSLKDMSSQEKTQLDDLRDKILIENIQASIHSVKRWITAFEIETEDGDTKEILNLMMIQMSATSNMMSYLYQKRIRQKANVQPKSE